MNLREKLRYCSRFIRENGYPDAEIVRTEESEMIVFSIPNTTAKYPNEKPTISVAFAQGSMNNGEIDFDILQIMCFIASGVPGDRLDDIQKFCSDFNKTMQIGHFGTDRKNETVYFKCAQVISRDISSEMLSGVLNQIFTMILFYFGYSYEILIELSYGIIGYGGTSRKLMERKRILDAAMAELNGEKPAPKPEKPDRNMVVEELLAQLKKDNPELLEKANIDVDDVRRRQGKTKKQASAEDAAAKLMGLAKEAENQAAKAKAPQKTVVSDLPVEVRPRTTVKDRDSSQYKKQMPSIEMFTQREKRQPEPPLDMEALKKALADDQKDRQRVQQVRRDSESRLTGEINEKSGEGPVKAAAPAPGNARKENSESLVQRLRNWTQN